MDSKNLNNDNITNEINEKDVSLQNGSELDNMPVDEFAAAFPEWNLVPPLQVIKRVRRSL